VREPRRTGGARAPLFDRLVDLDPHAAEEAEPLRVLDRAGLRASVRRELERLLNTRCPWPEAALAGRPRTVLEYGMPDFSHLYARGPAARGEIAAMVERTVAAYEPRLRRPRVVVEEDAGSERRLTVRIEGVLVVGEVQEAVSFSDLPLEGWPPAGSRP
jgi:type VI secretion system protein ImpF